MKTARLLVKDLFSNRKIKIVFLLLVLLLISIRLVIFFSIPPWDHHNYEKKVLNIGDAHMYHNYAIAIIKNGIFTDYKYGMHRTLGYPLFLVPFYICFGNGTPVVLAAQIIIDLFSALILMVLLYYTTASLLGALVSFGLYGINMMMAVYPNLVYTESLFLFFFLLSILSIFLLFSNGKISTSFLAGVCIGISTIIRPVTTYLPILIIITLLVYKKINLDFKRGILLGFFLFLGFFIIVLPQQVKNYVKYDRFTISEIQNINLYLHNVATIKSYEKNEKIGEVREQLRKEIEKEEYTVDETEKVMQFSSKYKSAAINYIKKNTVKYSLFHFKGIAAMFLDNTEGKTLDEYVFSKSNLNQPKILYFFLWVKEILIFIMVMLSLFFIIKFKDYNKYLVIIFVLLFYMVNVVGVLGWVDRLTYPIVPLEIMFVGYFISKLQYLMKLRKQNT